MGNKLSSLPIPSFVGGTLDVGDDPLSRGNNSRPSTPSFGLFRSSSNFGGASPSRGGGGGGSTPTTTPPPTGSDNVERVRSSIDELRVKTDAELREKDHGQPLAYSTTFFLKDVESERYLSSGTDNICQHGAIQSTSLMTFHGQRGARLNKRGDKELVKVKNGASVTMYANIRFGGQYLTPNELQTSDKTKGKQLHWHGKYEVVKQDSLQYEFIVRRAKPKSKSMSTRKMSFPKLKMFRSMGNRRSSVEGGGAASVGRSKTPPPQTSQHHEEEDNNDSVAVPPSLASTSSGAVLQHCSRSDGLVELSRAGVIQEDANAQEPLDYICLGDIITLESKSRPGHFLVLKNSGLVQLSANEVGHFVVAVPQLRHLVTLNVSDEQNMLSHVNTATDMVNGVDGSGTPKPKRILSEEEAKWLLLLQRLPLDIVYRILQFKGRWVRTARLVSRDWCQAAEAHVHGIRVNGEFAGITTLNEHQSMLYFIKRCKHLTSLTLRNIDDLRDDDMESILACVYLRRLALGGCIHLTDSCVERIEKLEHLNQLNLAATLISDAGLEMILTKLPQLEDLNVYGCQRVTFNGLVKVMELPNLKSLNIRGTRLDKNNTEELQRRYPDVQILTGPLYVDGIYG